MIGKIEKGRYASHQTRDPKQRIFVSFWPFLGEAHKIKSQLVKASKHKLFRSITNHDASPQTSCQEPLWPKSSSIDQDQFFFGFGRLLEYIFSQLDGPSLCSRQQQATQEEGSRYHVRFRTRTTNPICDTRARTSGLGHCQGFLANLE